MNHTCGTMRGESAAHLLLTFAAGSVHLRGTLPRGNHVSASALSMPARLLTAGCAALLLATTGVIARPLAAQVPETQVAQAYIDTHADFEDMVYVPMRDGVRLYHLIIFPKGQARQNFPTVIIR